MVLAIKRILLKDFFIHVKIAKECENRLEYFYHHTTDDPNTNDNIAPLETLKQHMCPVMILMVPVVW